MIVAFFDFDHTITTKDSFIDFAHFVKGKKAFNKVIVDNLFKVVGYKLGIVSGGKIKEVFLKALFKGMSEEEFKKKGREYAEKCIPKITNPKAIERLQWHKQQGHHIVIVTASINFWIQPWTNTQQFDLIATQIEVVENKITGCLKGENCNGSEKVRRIRERYDLSQISDSYAYGDSKGDKEMLQLAKRSFFRYF